MADLSDWTAALAAAVAGLVAMLVLDGAPAIIAAVTMFYGGSVLAVRHISG